MSKIVKKYILSIDSEVNEYFCERLIFLENEIKKLSKEKPLSLKIINPLIDKFIEDFLQTTISLVDFYVDGIYDSGKNVSRKKLKLSKQKPKKGDKYSFTKNDKSIINDFKFKHLTLLNNKLNQATTKYVIQKLSDSLSIEKIIECISKTYDEVMDIVTREILVFFRKAQIEEYKNLNIDTINIVIEDETLCCPICAVHANKIIYINDISSFDLIFKTEHSYCKYSIDPIIYNKNETSNLNNNHLNKVNIDFNIDSLKFKNTPIEIEYRIIKLIKKFQIYAKQFLEEIEFIFVDDIINEDMWYNLLKNYYITIKGMDSKYAEEEVQKTKNNLKNKIISLDFGDRFYISISTLNSQTIEEIIVRKLISNKVKIDDWVKERYKKKKESKHLGNGVVIYQNQFVNYLAEESPENYLIESIVNYVIQPQKIKAVDSEVFEYIKENIFNGIQFF